MESTQISATVDYEKPGKQVGHLAVPYSHNLGGWANLQVPVAVLAAGEGPTVLLMAGNHGDEYPGQVAILKLCRDLPLEVVRGRLIMIPALSVPAAKAAARLSPLDGRNFNRCFPGDPAGSVSEMLAHYVTTHLFPMADAVIDLHSGGRSFDFYPCAHMHLVPDRDQRRKMVAAAEAYNTDFAFLYTDVAGSGLLPVEAERQGKVVVTTEMGGGEPVPARVHRLSQEGLRNVLVHLGVVAGKLVADSALARRARPAADALGAVTRPPGLPFRARVGDLRERRRSGQQRGVRGEGRSGPLPRAAGPAPSRLPSSRRRRACSSAAAAPPSSARATASPASPTTSIRALSSDGHD